jgi:hypothetical protein
LSTDSWNVFFDSNLFVRYVSPSLFFLAFKNAALASKTRWLDLNIFHNKNYSNPTLTFLQFNSTVFLKRILSHLKKFFWPHHLHSTKKNVTGKWNQPTFWPNLSFSVAGSYFKLRCQEYNNLNYIFCDRK